jgi:hypothetical protein
MRIFVVIISGFIIYPYCLTQSNFNSLDTPVDARSIAMGESFVAYSNSSSSSFYNPATLALSEGITSSFSKRYLTWLSRSQNMYYLSWNAALKTSVGSFGLFYNRFNEGEGEIRDEYNSYIGRENVAHHTYGITYAKEVFSHLDAGITLKTYNEIRTISEIVQGQSRTFTTTPPILIDAGIVYHQPGFCSGNVVEDNISSGITFQNFGTDYKINGRYERIPRYARLGIAYTLRVKGEREEMLEPFQFVFTGQYCNHLNAPKIMLDERDYWNAGMEATFYEIVFLRMGGIARPYTDIYGFKGVAALRYGFGINIPIEKLIESTPPFSVCFDFAAIPLSDYAYWWEWTYIYSKKTLTAFSFELKYNSNLF